MKKLLKSKKGFTLVEMIVVIVIIAILTAALVFSLIGYVNKGKAATAQVEASNAYTATQAYISETMSTEGADKLTRTGMDKYVNEMVGSSVAQYVGDVTYDNNGTITAFSYTAANGVTCTYANSKWTTDATSIGTGSGSLAKPATASSKA